MTDEVFDFIAVTVSMIGIVIIAVLIAYNYETDKININKYSDSFINIEYNKQIYGRIKKC